MSTFPIFLITKRKGLWDIKHKYGLIYFYVKYFAYNILIFFTTDPLNSFMAEVPII